MDPIQTMPEVDSMATKDYTLKQWLQYYKNVWTRNLVARTIDIETDTILKASNPDEVVQMEDGSTVKVGVRLEARKIAVSDARKLVDAINAMMPLTEEELAAKFSDDALKVAADMVKKADPEIGSPCTTEDGKPGVWMKQGEAFVCAIATENSAAPADAAETDDTAKEEATA